MNRSMMIARWVRSLGIACVLGGCSLVTEPEALPVELTVSRAGADMVPLVDVVAGEVRIVGAFTTGAPCYTFAAHAAYRRNVLDVRLTATGIPGACIGVLATHRYNMRVNDLPAGSWRVRVTIEDAEVGRVTTAEAHILVNR